MISKSCTINEMIREKDNLTILYFSLRKISMSKYLQCFINHDCNSYDRISKILS